jgi:hypothetical protein
MPHPDQPAVDLESDGWTLVWFTGPAAICAVLWLIAAPGNAFAWFVAVPAAAGSLIGP